MGLQKIQVLDLIYITNGWLPYTCVAYIWRWKKEASVPLGKRDFGVSRM